MISERPQRTLTAVFFVAALSFCRPAYAADRSTVDAQIFARQHVKEIAAMSEEERKSWRANIGVKMGLATYEEDEDDIDSDYKIFYPEIVAAAEKRFENDIGLGAEFSFGHSLTATETWNLSGEKYQTNDMDFYRINLKGDIGKSFYFGYYRPWEITPFAGYGYRFINFERTNFNILDIITSRDVVNEKYYIYHLDLGVKFSKEIDPLARVSGALSYARVIYNQADNSARGKIKGKGGYLVDGSLNLEYSLNETWRLVWGGFFELQSLNGGTKGGFVWPDNNLNIYGMQAQMKAEF